MSEQAARSFRFAIAEDDENFLYLVHHTLLTAFPGCSIATFSNAGDALAHVTSAGTDLLITDHGMGVVTGTELIRDLRSQCNTLPIIMISGNELARKEAIEAGANEFIHKDVGMKGLLESVKRHLNFKKQIKQSRLKK
jgi:CheY-like chemotaxis protein